MKFSRLHRSLLASMLFASTFFACASAQPDQRATGTSTGASTSATAAVERNPARLAHWEEVEAFIDEMTHKHGFTRAQLQNTLRKTRHNARAVQLMQPAPPGQARSWQAYRARFVEPVRINAGVAFWDRHAQALSRAEQEYGVPPEIIVGILGVETVYGQQTGKFRVMDVLATLAFDYPDAPNQEARKRYFRGELENTLLLARESAIDPFALYGSYAGAIGWPQFMPGSIRQYAVDFDGDGKIDLRNSAVDAIGSIANFLVQHGWKTGQPLVFPAIVDEQSGKGWQSFIGQGLEAKFSLTELEAGGVVLPLAPPPGLAYGLIDLQNGAEPTEYWLGTNNFFAITKYNRSFFYAMSVIDLGRAVRAARAG